MARSPREVKSVSLRKLAARAGLLGIAAAMVVGGGFGATVLPGTTATGSTVGGPSPPPHPNV